MTEKSPSNLRNKTTQDQQKLLEQYADLIASNTREATIQAVNDQITHYELQGIQEGYKAAKKEVVTLMQEKLNTLNQQNSEKIIQMRATLPELEGLDEENNLTPPSLKEGIHHAHKTYNVLAESKKDDNLPNDLSDALNA